MAQTHPRKKPVVTSDDALSPIFLSEADAEREMLQARWRQGKEADATERARKLQIMRDVVQGKLGDENTLRVLRETTALKRMIAQEGWSLRSISHLEALIYGVCDAHASLDSPLWRGELAPLSMRLASNEEAAEYWPDSSGVTAQPPAGKKTPDAVRLPTGEKLVAQDAESQAVLDFMRHYLEPDADDPEAIIHFHRDLRIRENYAERTELALEAALTMHEIAKDFAKTLLHAMNTSDAQQRAALSEKADDLLMEFNLQRYGLVANLRNSHWTNPQEHAPEDRHFVSQLSRDLLVHALAQQSDTLPTVHELHSREFQGDTYVTVENYFNTAYGHIERVLGIRPHRDRVTQVPLVDEAQIDKPTGRLH